MLAFFVLFYKFLICSSLNMAQIVLRSDGFFDSDRLEKSRSEFSKAKLKLMHRLYEANHFNPSYESLLNSLKYMYSDDPLVGSPFVDKDGYSIYIRAKGLRYPVYYIGRIER
jgi:hypothetical protein